MRVHIVTNQYKGSDIVAVQPFATKPEAAQYASELRKALGADCLVRVWERQYIERQPLSPYLIG